MAKNLLFRKGTDSFELAPTKIERKKLYGFTELRVTTPDGELCRSASLESYCMTIIPKGATKMGMLREDGLWMDKTELVALHADGTPAETIASSFNAPIELNQKATMEELLDVVVSSVYQLDGEQCEALARLLGNDIYTFPFSYRGGYEVDLGYILSNGTSCFVIVGEKALFEFVGLEEQAAIDELDDEVAFDEDELDFSMM